MDVKECQSCADDATNTLALQRHLHNALLMADSAKRIGQVGVKEARPLETAPNAWQRPPA